MKRMSIFSLLVAAAFLPSWAFAGLLNQSDAQEAESESIDGKDVVVRVYQNCRQAPEEFEKVTIKIKGQLINFDFTDIDESAVVMVVGEDQTDAAVGKALGDYIYANSYKKGLHFSLPSSISTGGYLLTFTDALGNPISGATVEIWVEPTGGVRIFVGYRLLDEQGTLQIHSNISNVHQFHFIVGHPDYGIAKVNYIYFTGKQQITVFLPLVRTGTIADERSIRGVVVDSENNPISGALVSSSAVRTRAGIWAYSVHGWEYTVITDEQGRFWMYLPIGKDKEIIGELIPPRTKYKIRVEAPKELGLQPYVAYVPNDREVTIGMQSEGYFHTFVFEDGNSPITDPNTLKRIRISISESWEKPQIHLGFDEWKTGGMFPPGIYLARVSGVNGYPFERLRVTADSPEQLVFERPEGVPYYGQVVNEITGEPMQGVFVIAKTSHYSQRNLCLITPEQWDAMRALPLNPSADDPALVPLQAIYTFREVARTDQDGWFYMAAKPFHLIIAFAEDYLGIAYRISLLRPNENGIVEVPVIKLFPAARVKIEPLVNANIAAIKPQWLIDKDNNPAWVSELLAINDAEATSFTYGECISKNKYGTFCVPAGLNLRVQLRNVSDTQWHPIIIDQTINLQRGEVLDLGSYTFQPALKVFVRVVDSAGEPIEAVPIRKKVGEKYQYPTRSTDLNGMAQFYVLTYSSGEFVVEYYQDKNNLDALHLREAIAYEIAGPEDAGREFTLQLSDAMLYHLFK